MMSDADRAKTVRDTLWALLMLVTIGYYTYELLKVLGYTGGEDGR